MFTELTEAKNQIVDNLNLMLERDYLIDKNLVKAQEIDQEAKVFKARSQKVKNKFCMRRYMMIAAALIVLLVIIVVVILIATLS